MIPHLPMTSIHLLPIFVLQSNASNDSCNTRPTPIHCCVPMISNPNPLSSNPLPFHPTEVDCCVPLPDSPDFKLPVNACHEYIKRKVLQHEPYVISKYA
jgi:hypothetical protein